MVNVDTGNHLREGERKEKAKEYLPPLPRWDPERCPRCGGPMIRGRIIATILGFSPTEKWPGTVERLTVQDYTVGGPFWKQSWKGGGIRSYFCKSCELYVSYEQDPKTGERSGSPILPRFPVYSQPEKEEKK